MRLLLSLLLVSLLALATSLTPPAASQHSGAPKVFCEHPRALRLHRFEDRSARLECGGRVLVRISVPG
jgi:hypothetical protein